MEHNLGHHKNVATPDDPATAKRGQSIYFFWIKSIIGTYVNAWRLQSRLLRKEQKSFFSIANKQLMAAAIQILFLSVY
jgi:alkane 1-monooxygenase